MRNVMMNGTMTTIHIPMPNANQPPGMIDKMPGTPPTPIELALTCCIVMNAPASEDPITAAINGYLNRKLTPNIAGSVTPSQADTPDDPDSPLVRSLFVANIIAKAAAPWTMLDNESIGHKNVEPEIGRAHV